MDITQHIQERIRDNRYEISFHAEREQENEHLLVAVIEESVLLSSELLEDYPDDPRGHSCLVLGFN